MASDAIEPGKPGTEIEERGHSLRSTLEHEIGRRAYEIYLDRGAQPDRELEDWLKPNVNSRLSSAAHSGLTQSPATAVSIGSVKEHAT